MNANTYKLYKSKVGVSLIDKNIKGDRNIGQIMSLISPLTNQLGVDCYETAKDIIKGRKAETSTASLSKADLSLVERLQASMD